MIHTGDTATGVRLILDQTSFILGRAIGASAGWLSATALGRHPGGWECTRGISCRRLLG